MQFYTRSFLGIQISPAAKIGPGLFIGHFGGIVISGRAAKAPVIGDRVYIGPGAVLYGGIHVGDEAKIGPNAVIHKDVPAQRTAVAWPGFKLLEES